MLTAVRVPFIISEKDVPSLITGDDFVLAPVETLQSKLGDDRKFRIESSRKISFASE